MARKMKIDTSIAADIKSAASDSFKDNIKMIEIGKIKASLDNFYSMSDVDILADDIERQGLKHNLVVVEDSDEHGTYFIKSGHRRYAAIQQLVSEGRYNSKYIPCLIDGSKTKDESILDLIMLNATTRVMSDSEIFKQYEVLKETLDNLKASGDYNLKGRMREKLALTRRATSRAKSVLATPGTPSMSTCPSAMTEASTRSTASCCPTMMLDICCLTCVTFSVNAVKSVLSWSIFL